MSEVKRYAYALTEVDGTGHRPWMLVEDRGGKYVLAAEYDRLKQERDTLQARVRELEQDVKWACKLVLTYWVDDTPTYLRAKKVLNGVEG